MSTLKTENIQHPNALTPNISLTASAMSINSASVVNDLVVNGGTLFADAANNRVGIGTLSPQGMLHVVSSGNTYMNIDSSGRVTTSFQPFFTGCPTNTTGSGTSNSLHTVTNVGMSVSGGRITVPIAGKYQISFNTISNSSTGRVDASILVNGAQVVILLSEDNGTGYHQKTGSIVRSLQANDYIEFTNGSWYNAAVTTFEIWRTCSVVYLG